VEQIGHREEDHHEIVGGRAMSEMMELCFVPPPPVTDDLVSDSILYDRDLADAGEPRLRPKTRFEARYLPREQLDE